eukprot:scaffold149972_cov27-Tisochrysis_lutea.AAC.1
MEGVANASVGCQSHTPPPPLHLQSGQGKHLSPSNTMPCHAMSHQTTTAPPVKPCQAPQHFELQLPSLACQLHLSLRAYVGTMQKRSAWPLRKDDFKSHCTTCTTSL